MWIESVMKIEAGGIKGPLKGIAKDHSKSLVRSNTCLVILDYFHFTPLVLIGKIFFSETRSKTRSGDL